MNIMKQINSVLNILTQTGVYILSRNIPENQKGITVKASNPKIIVINNCEILPTNVEKMAFILFSLSKERILPANSPVRLGVKMEMVIPEKMAFIEVNNPIF